MDHVDYASWAAYVDEFLREYLPGGRRLLELGCGTGTFALELLSHFDYEYLGTDRSAEMISRAREKARRAGMEAVFEMADFTRFEVSSPFDYAILLYDGLNYLLEEDQIRSLFRCVCSALRPGGIFFFDQSTPANSINNERYFSAEGKQGGFSYVRHSRYDREAHLHTTTFELDLDGERFTEQHVQRAYGIDEMRRLIAETPFEVLAAFEDFTSRPATLRAERIHWALRKPDRS